MEEDTKIDIVNMMPKKRKLKKKAHGAMGGAGPRRNLRSHDKTRQDKTRQDCLSYYLFVKKNKLFLVFGSCNSIAELTSSKKGNLSGPMTLSRLFQCYIQVQRSHPYQD